MTHEFVVPSGNRLDLAALCQDLSVELLYEEAGAGGVVPHRIIWLWQPELSTTLFRIDQMEGHETVLRMDVLASMADYRLFPYLADGLHHQLCGHGVEQIFQRYDEDWAAEAIGEAIAYVKAHLVLQRRYYLALPFQPLQFVDAATLAEVGVSVHSATPRIYGYIQHLQANENLPVADAQEVDWGDEPSDEVEVDIPQHQSIGRVKSWQADGSETWESFAQADVDALLALGQEHRCNRRILAGVVLNDIGTLYQEGIGVAQDGIEAAYWLQKAIGEGEHWFAPSNLGDLYRKGCRPQEVDLRKAVAAYRLGKDPYAHFRIGQAFEEGWEGDPNLEAAQKWYEKAASEGHHLALKRLGLKAT